MILKWWHDVALPPGGMITLSHQRSSEIVVWCRSPTRWHDYALPPALLWNGGMMLLSHQRLIEMVIWMYSGPTLEIEMVVWLYYSGPALELDLVMYIIVLWNSAWNGCVEIKCWKAFNCCRRTLWPSDLKPKWLWNFTELVAWMNLWPWVQQICLWHNLILSQSSAKFVCDINSFFLIYM